MYTAKQIAAMKLYAGYETGEFVSAKKSLIDQASIEREAGITALSGLSGLSATWGTYTYGNLTTLYHTMAEVYAPIQIIASRIAGAEWQVRKKNDDSVVKDNTYMNALMAQTNPLQTWPEFIYQLEAGELTTGMSYVYANAPDLLKAVNYRTINSLVNLPSESVQIQTQPIIKLLSATTIDDLIISYLSPDGMMGMTPISPNKVLYSKEPSLYAYDTGIHGRSRLLSAQKAVNNLIAVYEARNVIYTRRGMLGLIVSAATDGNGSIPLTPDEKKEVIDDLQTKYGLTKNQSPIAVTNHAVNYLNIGMSIKDLEPFVETKHDAAVIFGVYNVPRELMPTPDTAKYDNQSAAEKSVYENVVIPRAVRRAAALTRFLKLDEVGLYLHPSFEHVKVLQENRKEQSEVEWKNNETCRVRFGSGIITLNEWRIAAGGKPVVNTMYDKLVYEMSDDELKKVEGIIKLTKGSISIHANASDNNNSNAADNKQQSAEAV